MLIDQSITLSNMTDEGIQSVQNQLNIIFASKYFKSAKQLQRFLNYIVEKTIAGEEKYLKQYTIGVEALSFTNDFDSDENPAVRVMGCRIRKRLDEYYDDTGSNDELIISMPKGSYIPEFKKNAKFKKDTDSNLQTSCGPKLAVVSYTDKTQSETTNALLLQLTDTVATELSRFLCLKLTVCNPVADKDQSHLPATELKSTNSANYTLNLFFQKNHCDENKYWLIYRLALVETNEILWSEKYELTERPIDEQGHIIGKITATVADHLQGMMHTHWSRKLLENKNTIPDIHKVLTQYRYYTDRLGVRAFVKGVNACKEALKKNPNDVIANVILSAYCRHEYVFGYGVIDSPLEDGLKCANTAIRYNPNSHEARYVLGQILFCQNNLERCLEEFELARRICKSNIVIEFGVGFHYCMMDQWDKGFPLVEKAMSLSTVYSPIYHMVPFLNHYRQEKYEQALLSAKRITTPGLVHGPLARSISYLHLGQLEEAEKEFQEVLRRYPEFMETGKHFMNRFFGAGVLVDKIWDDVLTAKRKSRVACPRVG